MGMGFLGARLLRGSLFGALAVSMVAIHVNSSIAQSRSMALGDLPRDIQKHIAGVRDSCKELNEEFKPHDPMQGVGIISLTGNGSRDIMIDNEGLCNAHTAGANCSNRGCDFLIWKQVGTQAWRIAFKEHFHRKFISTNRDTGQLQAIVASIYAGDPRCKPTPGKHYTSGMSCDLIITYRNGDWIWQVIR